MSNIATPVAMSSSKPSSDTAAIKPADNNKTAVSNTNETSKTNEASKTVVHVRRLCDCSPPYRARLPTS